MAKHLYAMHDYDPTWANNVKAAGKTGWVVETLEIGANPDDTGGGDFSDRESYGLTVIGRLNYSHHGNGTIPDVDRYDDFATRCYNYVKASKGCTHWIIGNEPNLIGERPNKSISITPTDYVNCYALCYDAIKVISKNHRVMVAPVAPYNIDTGPWIDYWKQVLLKLRGKRVTTDGLPLHTYSRGPEVNSVRSDQKMDPPYQAYYNGFRGYRDLLEAVPSEYRSLPAYITETDQMEAWRDSNSGWVLEAYREINDWNQEPGKTRIHCLALYRWPHFDQWYIVGKQGVISDFQQTLNTTNYLAPEETAPKPPITGPLARVTAPAGANIRTGPSTGYTILGAEPFGTGMSVLGRNDSRTWWKVQSPTWGLGWVSASVVAVEGGEKVPVIPGGELPPAKVSPNQWLIWGASKVLGIDPLVGEAFIEIESAGQAYVGNDMVIRFETHVFRDWVARIKPDQLPQVDATFSFGSPPWTNQKWRPPGKDWQPLHDNGQQEERAAFQLAMTINEEAALRSISMGAGQVLGSNYAMLGYKTPREMYEAFTDKDHGAGNQILGMFAYLRANGLIPAAQVKDWKALATGYNGPGQADYYAKILRDKYLELGGTKN